MVAQREQGGPQLRYQHADHRGIGPAPAVNGIGKAVGEIAERGDEQQGRIQNKLQAKLQVPFDAEQKEGAQKRRARVAERAVFQLYAGKKALRELAAGAALIEEMDGRFE